MKRFIFGLVIAMTIMQTAAFAQLRTGYASLRVSNKSDACAKLTASGPTAKTEKGYVGAHEEHVMSIAGNNAANIRIIADIYNCKSGAAIIQRYDYIPAPGGSQLSIHKNSNGSYIMRQGP